MPSKKFIIFRQLQTLDSSSLETDMGKHTKTPLELNHLGICIETTNTSIILSYRLLNKMARHKGNLDKTAYIVVSQPLFE